MNRTTRTLLAGSLLLLALVTTASRPASQAAFSATTQSAANTLTLGALSTPGPATCTWASSTSLTLNWTDTNGSVATAHQVERSNTSGSGYATAATTSPASVVTWTDTGPSPPTLRWYRLAATAGTWISPYTAEVASNQCAGSIVAFAGGGATTTCSWSGAATSLHLQISDGVAPLATDSAGNLYVADTGNNCIRRIDPSGNVSWVAGGGATTTCGTTTAASLKLVSPGGVAVDAGGNVYVADSGNNCVRRIDTSGNVTAVAGGGATTTCGTTTATGVKLTTPWAVAVDGSANVYVADSGNRCLRKVAGSTVTVAAGTGASAGSCAATGTAGTSLAMAEVDAVSVDGSGNVYVADGTQSCLYKLSGGTATRLAGKSGASQGSCTFTGDPSTVSYDNAYTPGAATASNGTAYFAIELDGGVMNRACVIRIASAAATRIAGQNGTGTTGDNGPAVAAYLNQPGALATSPTGDLFVADGNLIRRVVTP